MCVRVCTWCTVSSPKQHTSNLHTVLSCDQHFSRVCLLFVSCCYSDLFPEATIMFADLVGYVYFVYFFNDFLFSIPVSHTHADLIFIVLLLTIFDLLGFFFVSIFFLNLYCFYYIDSQPGLQRGSLLKSLSCSRPFTMPLTSTFLSCMFSTNMCCATREKLVYSGRRFMNAHVLHRLIPLFPSFLCTLYFTLQSCASSRRF